MLLHAQHGRSKLVTAAISHCAHVQVVEEYTKLKPNNPLARFLPALRSVAGQGDVFTGLNGFEAAVQQLGEDKGGRGSGWGSAWAAH